MDASDLTAENFTADESGQSKMCKTLPAWISHYFEGYPDSTLARLEVAALEYCGAIPRADKHCSHDCYVHCSAEQLANVWHRVILPVVSLKLDERPQPRLLADFLSAEFVRAPAYVSPLVGKHASTFSLN